MKSPDELESGEIFDIQNPGQFVELQENLPEHLTYFVIATEHDGTNTTRMAVGLVEKESDLSFGLVNERLALEALDQLDWIERDDVHVE